MKKYLCVECGYKVSKNKIDSENSYDGTYYCKDCTESLSQAGWDAVDPNHNFESFSDWDENGR
ncbi:hypothetical protein JZO80_13935 [Vagococcus fluvialis]|uniref:hypothetical protein n=1 Tax=Vagococcus fluvialis TaxID=2738 RepID=UPI000A352409|nr:hypothetical protein [Vagococcus fluvialis]MBO0421261.1 hypothetical protein [Vagococcus fluvialis]OTP33290.1 hypothetical protein A5798_000019 [Enterococcus sp. 6C8_DIV0013]